MAALALPPWVVLCLLVGLCSAALFHILLSGRLRQLLLYTLVGVVAAVVGGLLGARLGPTPWSLGEAHLLAICGATWSALALTHLLGG